MYTLRRISPLLLEWASSSLFEDGGRRVKLLSCASAASREGGELVDWASWTSSLASAFTNCSCSLVINRLAPRLALFFLGLPGLPGLGPLGLYNCLSLSADLRFQFTAFLQRKSPNFSRSSKSCVLSFSAGTFELWTSSSTRLEKQIWLAKYIRTDSCAWYFRLKTFLHQA